MKEDDRLGAYRVRTPVFNFYTGLKNIAQLENTLYLRNFFQNSQSRVFCLMKRKDFAELSPLMPFHLYQWDEEEIGRHEIILFSDHERR